MPGGARGCKGEQAGAGGCKRVQTVQGYAMGCRGCSGAKPAAPLAAADQGRRKRTIADQSILISAVLLASPYIFINTITREEMFIASKLWNTEHHNHYDHHHHHHHHVYHHHHRHPYHHHQGRDVHRVKTVEHGAS